MTELHELLKRGIKIYPEYDKAGMFAVCIEDPFNLIYKQPRTVGRYRHTTKSINAAITKAILDTHKRLPR